MNIYIDMEKIFHFWGDTIISPVKAFKKILQKEIIWLGNIGWSSLSHGDKIL